MIILGFDTCLDKMYVSLKNENGEINTRIVENTETHYHSAFLISTIKSILSDSKLIPNDVDLIATNIGPGSFTGIRACNTVARVFAQATGIKTIGISSLEILSRISDSNKVIVALDARKNMAYTALYENNAEIIKPQAILLDEVKDLINHNNCEVITDDKLQEIIGGKSYQKENKDLGKILLEITQEKIEKNLPINWSELKPLYIQPPPVTLKK